MSPVLKDPSEELPVEDQVYKLLGNKDLRRMYSKCLNACREYHHHESKSWFIQKLIDSKTIPSYYRIKKSSIDSNASESASLISMRRVLELFKTQALINIATMTSNYNDLAALTPDHLHTHLLAKIKERGLGYQQKFKLKNLSDLNTYRTPKPPQIPKWTLARRKRD